jgi:hypothetical protein
MVEVRHAFTAVCVCARLEEPEPQVFVLTPQVYELGAPRSPCEEAHLKTMQALGLADAPPPNPEVRLIRLSGTCQVARPDPDPGLASWAT